MNAKTLDGSPRRNRLRPWIWGAAAVLLLLPAFAMRFIPGSGVDWDGVDFVVMGAMLAVACGLYELGTRMSGNLLYRAAFGLAVLTGFLTVWVNLAVGMLGDGNNPANLMFAVVLLVAAAGALAARFRARGMAAVMVAAGLLHLLAVVLALRMDFRAGELLLTACFSVPWFASALLFRGAARQASAGA